MSNELEILNESSNRKPDKDDVFINKGNIATGGGGLWSKEARDNINVEVYVDNPIHDYGGHLGGFINAYFDPKQWITRIDGLIYTDKLFLKQLRELLRSKGIRQTDDLKYSEQGMQGNNFVNFDVGDKLATELIKKYNLRVEEI